MHTRPNGVFSIYTGFLHCHVTWYWDDCLQRSSLTGFVFKNLCEMPTGKWRGCRQEMVFKCLCTLVYWLIDKSAKALVVVGAFSEHYDIVNVHWCHNWKTLLFQAVNISVSWSENMTIYQAKWVCLYNAIFCSSRENMHWSQISEP